jgi:hypothetical protein
MSDALTTYLQDHLAGALHAIELLKAMRDIIAENRSASLPRNCSSRSRRTAMCRQGWSKGWGVHLAV